MSSADEIKKLKNLLDDGAITLDEFEQQKKLTLRSHPSIFKGRIF